MKRVLMVVCLLMMAACSSNQQTTFADLPAGDAARGATLFTQGANGAPACATCHTTDGSALVGPSLQNYAATAPVADAGAASLGEYTFTSITHPSAYIVSGYGNSMYTQYARQLTPQQIADLVAYLQTL